MSYTKNEQTVSERIELIEQAIALIEEASELLDEAVKGTSQESHYKAYGKYGIDDLLGNGNPYNTSLEQLKSNIEEEYEIEEDDEEEGE